MGFQGKLTNQTRENSKKARPHFGPFGPISTRCYILLQVIIVCSFKEN